MHWLGDRRIQSSHSDSGNFFCYCKLASYVFQVYRDHPWRMQSAPNYRSLHLNMEIQLHVGSDDTLGGVVHVYEETPLTDKILGDFSSTERSE